MQFLCTCISLIIVFATRNAHGANVALGRPATQSSTWMGFYTADRAVDGNPGTTFYIDTCTHTACYDYNPSWVVDLEKNYTIKYVTIYNPDIASDLLYEIRIEVFTTDPDIEGATGQLCNTIGADPINAASSVNLSCPSHLSGQYVKLEKTVTIPAEYNDYCDALLLCEVQVEATPIFDCPVSFESHHGSCYHFADDYVESWFEARMACQTIGGDLAVIESGEENTYIQETLSTLSGKNRWEFYAGLHKLQDHATWKWIDRNAVQGVPSGQPNKAVPFSDWAEGEGANTTEGHCLVIDRRRVPGTFAWFQGSCNGNSRYVCEDSLTFPRKP